MACGPKYSSFILFLGHLNCIWVKKKIVYGFPCGLAGKESACNMGDLGLIPGLERSPREGRD